MALAFIDEDGGEAPGVATAPTNSKLLSDYNALDAGGKAAFRASIAGVHNIVANTGAITALSNAQPGDTAGIAASTTAVYRLGGTDPARAGAWQNLVTGAPLDTDHLTFIDGDGGELAGFNGDSVLVDAWNELSPAQKAAFRTLIKPQYASVADQTARLALVSQVPGDYARQVGTGLFRLRVLPSNSNGNWDMIIAIAP